MTETMTIDFTRTALAALPARKRCHRTCPGWHVAHNSYGPHAGLRIERCDDCASERTYWLGGGPVICDEDVRALPEARTALRAEYRRLAKERDVERRALRRGAWHLLPGGAS